jgi:hypothetical protein
MHYDNTLFCFRLATFSQMFSSVLRLFKKPTPSESLADKEIRLRKKLDTINQQINVLQKDYDAYYLKRSAIRKKLIRINSSWLVFCLVILFQVIYIHTNYEYYKGDIIDYVYMNDIKEEKKLTRLIRQNFSDYNYLMAVKKNLEEKLSG